MYRPKSPTASSKPMNFSPSPQSRRKINNTKTHIQQQIVNTKQRVSIVPQQKHQRKSPLSKKCIFRNLEVDPSHSIESFKIKEHCINNQTPKFCVKPDLPKQAPQGPHSNPLCPSNFFSFGQKANEKIKTERKGKQGSQKQISKSPKDIKKKSVNMTANPKGKPEIGIFQSSSRQKKPNQSYLR